MTQYSNDKCPQCGARRELYKAEPVHAPTCPLREGSEFVEAQIKGKELPTFTEEELVRLSGAAPQPINRLPDLIVTRGGVPVPDQKQGIADFKAACLAGANDRQIGGLHYSKWTYQHWDFVVDIGLHYLIGCASKYVTRWRDKGGIQDLEKCLHYLQKATEADVLAFAPANMRNWHQCLQRFTTQLPHREGRAVYRMVSGDYEGAANQVRALIDSGL